MSITITWGTLILAIIVVAGIKLAIKAVEILIVNVAKAPGKGFSKVVNAISNYKDNKLQSKLDKEYRKADDKARLNAAYSNANYNNQPKIKALIAKKENRADRKALKAAKNK